MLHYRRFSNQNPISPTRRCDKQPSKQVSEEMKATNTELNQNKNAQKIRQTTIRPKLQKATIRPKRQFVPF